MAKPLAAAKVRKLPDDEARAYLQELADTMSLRQAAPLLGYSERSPDAVGALMDQYGVTRNRHRGKSPGGLLDFLRRARTRPQIRAFLGTADADDKLDARLAKLEGVELFWTRNTDREPCVVALPLAVAPLDIKPRIWTHRWQADGQPYLWVSFGDFESKKLKLVGLSGDAHFGAAAHDAAKFREYVGWIASRRDVFAYINGDLMENADGTSVRGTAIFEQEMEPRTQREEVAAILAPIAHKILWAIPGNHENRGRKVDFDPLEWVCDKLGIPYCQEPIYVDVLWQGHVFDFFCQHGRSASQTKGGKLNAAGKPLTFQDHTMFTIMGHVHDAMENRVMRVVRDRVNFALELRKQYVIILPAFMDYFGSYAAEAGYAPPARGAINAEIYPDGDYHAST